MLTLPKKIRTSDGIFSLYGTSTYIGPYSPYTGYVGQLWGIFNARYTEDGFALDLLYEKLTYKEATAVAKALVHKDVLSDFNHRKLRMPTAGFIIFKQTKNEAI